MNKFTGASIQYEDHVAHIAYKQEDSKLVYQLFLNRKNLHVNCYQDPRVAIIEEM